MISYTVARLDGSLSGLKNPANELRGTDPVSRVPRELFDEHVVHWRLLEHRRWGYADHITLGEARAAIRWLDGVARLPDAHRARVLSLQDNMAAAGSPNKGRSPSPC